MFSGLRLALAGVSLAVALVICGCTTVQIYQDPIAKFQTSINAANEAIRTYLLNVNTLIAQGNLYDKIAEGNTNDWMLSDVSGGIPENLIQQRLQALATISSYANALSAVVNSKDVENLGQAAKTFGDNLDSLNSTVTKLAGSKSSFEIGKPLASTVDLFGTLVIEHMQKKAVEQGIINGSTNVEAIIQALKTDLPKIGFVTDVSESSIWSGKLTIYNKLRAKADPKDIDALVTQFVQDYNKVQSLRTLQIGSLLDDMESANQALVSFAKSDKTPKDIASLASQIDVFAGHVQLFNNALSAIETSIKNAK
jgi:hypothetical protein